MSKYIAWFDHLTMKDVGLVGGKNASLGEMICHLSRAGVNVPAGFATTTEAYREFLAANKLTDRIKQLLDKLDVDDISALTAAGKKIRGWMMSATLPDTISQAVSDAYEKLVANSSNHDAISFAVRSSATARIWQMLHLQANKKLC